ncbi:vascular endothelial growth factor receptor 1 isoform X2 [Phymastichus coffea]|uniref:vascular endothelial growth factor receptor 1 isoform X2 n=1 Tax=Phymastichus coffea TaxID=108790 RepID=UPI00273B567C|nr:vascular endothelial growth factor receptor 1 isoform X2 [Phymastichus coffea]
MAWPNVAMALLLAVAGCSGYKPRLSPDSPEIVISEGDELVINCTSRSNFKLVFPETKPREHITTSEHEIRHESYGGEYVKRKFLRRSTVFGDTGWYGCVDEDADENNPGQFGDPNASWIYVYVKTSNASFVSENESRSIVATTGDSVVLPCRPTSPEVHVDLEFNYAPVEMDDRVSFDPRKGFVMKNMRAMDSGFYSCIIRTTEDDDDDDNMEIDISVKIVHKKLLPDPVISKDNLHHVTAGSELNVVCKAEVPSDSTHAFLWVTPSQVDPALRKEYQLNATKIDQHMKLVTGVLSIKSVTFDDEGEYYCKVQTLNNIIETHMYINIYDPQVTYLNLTAYDPYTHYQVDDGNPVKFFALVDGFPQPSVVWTRVPLDYDFSQGYQNSSVITSKDVGFDIQTTKSSSILKINQVSRQDAGIYVAVASNDANITKYLHFTLEVRGQPSTMLNNIDNVQFYSVNQTANFSCIAYNNPPADVKFIYYKCPHYPDLDNCQTVEIVSSVIQDTKTKKEIQVQFQAEMAGKVSCNACNSINCDLSESEFLVTDGVPNQMLGIVTNLDMVTANDNVTLTCMAPIYNSSMVKWMDKNNEPIPETDRIQIILTNTTFTRRAILQIKDVHKADEGDYFCISFSTDNNQDTTIVYPLIVNDPMEPRIKATNMNGSEIELTVDEAHNIRLTCYVEGKPYPETKWYKDDQPIKSDGQQFIIVGKNEELIINYLMDGDSGEYSCIAENRVNKVKTFQKFLVKGPEISIVWIIAMLVLLILLIILLIYFCIKIRREKRMRKQLIEAGLMHFEEGALDCINPDLTVDDQADLLPYDRKWEFPRNKLKLGRQLGSGAFGVVMKAEARGILADESITTVAVKMVHRNAEPAYIRALASELKIMVHLGKHLNVVNLLGACTNNIAKRELLVIVEYCRYGNLHNYLLRHREDFINQIDPETGRIDPVIGNEFLIKSTNADSNNSLSSASDHRSAPGIETVIYTTETQDITGLPEAGVNSNGSQPGWRSNYRGDYKDGNLKPICTQDLLSWAFQVARGMEYLCQRKVLHGDLAARNILLAENNVVKICDFGLAKTMYKDDNYQKKGDSPVPIKWMAVESIRDRVFSTQSDIWSFGIVLWEFFTLAETPYPGMTAETQYQRLIEGYRMEQPKYATKDLYNIMLQCWKAKPTLRPSFSELVEDIGELLEEGVKKHYVELNSLYIDTIDEKHDYLQMMSSPDHAALASPQHDYINCPIVTSPSPLDESGIFSPRPNTQENSRFQFPSSATAKIANTNNSDGEDSPMLKKLKEEPELDEDNYLKPIDVQKKRDEFTRKREAEKRKSEERNARVSTDRDSGYCNTPKALELVDVKMEAPNYRNLDEVDVPMAILKTPDEKYSWQQRSVAPESFMNPSYAYFNSNKKLNQETV